MAEGFGARERGWVPERSQPEAGRAAQSGVPVMTASTCQPPLCCFWREASAASWSLTPAQPAHGGVPRRQPS
jgi:hypothetical protein